MRVPAYYTGWGNCVVITRGTEPTSFVNLYTSANCRRSVITRIHEKGVLKFLHNFIKRKKITIRPTVIIIVADLYGCEPWSVTLREERSLKTIKGVREESAEENI
jgi:hypothetical protein